MAKKRVSKKYMFFREFIAAGVLSLIVMVVLSFASQKLGDELLLKDEVSQAEKFYVISKLTNPLNRGVYQRLLATRVILEERRTHSEETDGENKPVAIASQVLGARVLVPVLMYHYIRVNPDSHDKVGYNLSVTPTNFEAQMNYLATHGYHTITLDELGAALLSNAKLPEKPIVITLDDGYRDAHMQAFPILKNHGFRAVEAIITGLVGAPNYLTWDQIDEMKRSGVFTFASHTVHHSALTYLYNDAATRELIDSKNVLQAHVGYVVNWFVYPYGNVNARVSSLVPKTGYVGAFGTNNGAYQSTDYMFTLPRVRIGGGDSVSSFAAKLPW